MSDPEDHDPSRLLQECDAKILAVCIEARFYIYTEQSLETPPHERLVELGTHLENLSSRMPNVKLMTCELRAYLDADNFPENVNAAEFACILEHFHPRNDTELELRWMRSDDTGLDEVLEIAGSQRLIQTLGIIDTDGVFPVARNIDAWLPRISARSIRKLDVECRRWSLRTCNAFWTTLRLEQASIIDLNMRILHAQKFLEVLPDIGQELVRLNATVHHASPGSKYLPSRVPHLSLFQLRSLSLSLYVDEKYPVAPLESLLRSIAAPNLCELNIRILQAETLPLLDAIQSLIDRCPKLLHFSLDLVLLVFWDDLTNLLEDRVKSFYHFCRHGTMTFELNLKLELSVRASDTLPPGVLLEVLKQFEDTLASLEIDLGQNRGVNAYQELARCAPRPSTLQQQDGATLRLTQLRNISIVNHSQHSADELFFAVFDADLPCLNHIQVKYVAIPFDPILAAIMHKIPALPQLESVEAFFRTHGQNSRVTGLKKSLEEICESKHIDVKLEEYRFVRSAEGRMAFWR